MSYLGYRKPLTEIKSARNVYETIHYMNLGQMSGLKTIPEFYVRFLLGYVIQVSRAMAHAHSNKLVHGHFDLSRVLVQTYNLNQYEMEQINKSTKTGVRALVRKTSLDFEQKKQNYNFHVSNFEPYQVTKKLM